MAVVVFWFQFIFGCHWLEKSIKDDCFFVDPVEFEPTFGDDLVGVDT